MQPHVTLVDILEAEMKSFSWAGPLAQLPVLDVFSDVALHI